MEPKQTCRCLCRQQLSLCKECLTKSAKSALCFVSSLAVPCDSLRQVSGGLSVASDGEVGRLNKLWGQAER